CVCCEQDREYVYTGPVYAEADLNDKLCPWCIENGLAHKKYGAEFTDRASIGGYDNSAGKMVSQEIMYEIAYRTPGFIGWQQSQWLAHCGDGCKFLGLAGKREIEAYQSKSLVDSIRTDSLMRDDEFGDYYSSLEKDGEPTAYIFQCLHCAQYYGYSDFS